MKSSNPRTYSRKRKETEEAKFDTLFAPGPQKIMVEVDEIKKKRHKATVDDAVVSTTPNRLIKIEYSVNGAKLSPTKSAFGRSEQNKNSAAEKFDMIFGSKSPTKTTKTSAMMSKTSATHDMNSDDETIEITRTGFTANSSETKYDALFKKNEKSASEKFDALFGDDLPPAKEVKTEDIKHQSPDFDNLFGFGDESSNSESSSLSQKTVNHAPDGCSSPSKRVKPLPIITGATMKTVDGKVVLNIQRGGKKTPVHSPTKSVKTRNFDRHKTDSSTQEKGVSNNESSKDIFDVDNLDDRGLSQKVMQETKQSRSRAKSSFEENLDFVDAPVSLVGQKINATRSSTCIKQSTDKKSPTLRKFSKTTTHSNSKTNASSKPSYKSRPWMTDSEDATENKKIDEVDSQSLSQPTMKSDDSMEIVPKLTRSTTWPENVGESIVTSLKCNKNAKAYFTVVKHVKNYQSCLEEGEAQEFEDEVEYLLEGLQPSQPVSIRCLSATNLATKCQQHNFRLYLRAHNISMKVFSHLQDAAGDKALSLATSVLLFMLSRDRRMEIDKTTLQLLLKLLDPLEREASNRNGSSPAKGTDKDQKKATKYKFFKSKSGTSTSDDEKNLHSVQSKVEELVEASGDSLLTGRDADMKRLASEALLRFTARRTTEWFREEIRIKGGLDHIISLVKQNVDMLVPSTEVTEQYEQILGLLERILKVLENAIVNSPRNSMYLVTHQRALLLKKMAALLKLCQDWLVIHPGSTVDSSGDGSDSSKTNRTYLVLYNCVTQIVRLLVNISNDNEWVSNKVGDQEEMLSCIAKCILTTPKNLKENHRYDISLLGLGLLVNLVESSAKNRMSLMKMEISASGKFPADGRGDAPTLVGVVQSFVKLFYEHESAARDNEVLGEEGVKKAAEAKRNESQGTSDSKSSSSQRSELKSDPKDGRWVETEDGMEWIPAEDDDEQSLGGSQESVRARNPEAGLTVEEKAQMQDTLSKANDHMEHSIMASHAALVLGCLIHGSRANLTPIRAHLDPSSDFAPMISMLRKFHSFMSMTAGMSQKGEKKLIQIIEDLEEVNISTS